MEINDFDDLLTLDLAHLYSIESQIIDALPTLIENASSKTLKNSLEKHLETTKDQLQRLEDIGEENELNLDGEEEMGLKTIREEGEKLLDSTDDEELIDAIIMSGTAKVEHYEMACYEGAIAIAKKLEKDDIADILQETYDEEKDAANNIHMMSQGGVMSKIAHAM